MEKLETARIQKATYENIYFECPYCQTENVLNRATDLESGLPVSGKEVMCQSCERKVWLTSDRVAKADYILFLSELPELKRKKLYREYILSLCQGVEMFFTQALINYRLDRNPLYRDMQGIVNLDAYNQMRQELKSALKGGGFVMLRDMFRKEFEPYRATFKPQSLYDIKDKRAESFKELSRTKINELRNMVVHGTAYRPTLQDIEDQAGLEDAITWLGLYLDITNSVSLLNKKLGRPKIEDADPRVIDRAKKLYSERHKNNKTVDAISKELGISRATLYRYISEDEIANSRIWHTPIKAYSDFLKMKEEYGLEAVMKQDKFQKVRETRALAVLCFAMYKATGTPWYLQLDPSEVTDGVIMRMSPTEKGGIEKLRVEHTTYVRRNDGKLPEKSLLEQLKASKTFASHHKYDEHTAVVVDLGTGFDKSTGVDFESIAAYLQSIDAPYQLWALEEVAPVNGDTVVQFTRCTPDVRRMQIDIGEAWHEQYEKGIRGTIVANRGIDVEKAGKIIPREKQLTRAVWEFE